MNKVGPTLGGFVQKAVEWQEAEEGSAYAVPQGCIVRNTFLEWQEGEVESTRGLTADSKPARPNRNKINRTLLRSQSCPEQALNTAIYVDHEEGICPPRRSKTGNNLQYVESVQSPVQQPAKYLSDNNLDVQAGWPNCSDVNESGTSGSANDDDFAEGGHAVDENTSWNKNRNYEDSLDGPWKSRSPKASRRDNKGKGRDAWSVQTPANSTTMTLRGLPFSLSEADLLHFIEEAGVSKYDLARDRPCSLLQNPQGRPSGFAEIQLASGADFWEVREKIHMQRLGGRYIEALAPRDTGKPLGKARSPPSTRQSGRANGSWRG